jgi:hypothetical protein
MTGGSYRALPFSRLGWIAGPLIHEGSVEDRLLKLLAVADTDHPLLKELKDRH